LVLLPLWRYNGIRKRHPSRLLLLPHGHHSHRGIGKWLAVARAAHCGGVGHHVSLAVQLSLELAQRVILQLQLLQVIECCGTIELPSWHDRNVVRCQALLHFVPVLGFHLLPEHAFQALASCDIRKSLRWALLPDGASRKRNTQQYEQYQASKHGAIVP